MKNLTPKEIFTRLAESYPEPVELAVSDSDCNYNITKVIGYNPSCTYPLISILDTHHRFAALPTRRMWFEYGLPKDICKRAIEIMPEKRLNSQLRKSDVLWPIIFELDYSSEGLVFWKEVNNAFMDGKPHAEFPKLPEPVSEPKPVSEPLDLSRRKVKDAIRGKRVKHKTEGKEMQVNVFDGTDGFVHLTCRRSAEQLLNDYTFIDDTAIDTKWFNSQNK